MRTLTALLLAINLAACSLSGTPKPTIDTVRYNAQVVVTGVVAATIPMGVITIPRGSEGLLQTALSFAILASTDKLKGKDCQAAPSTAIDSSGIITVAVPVTCMVKGLPVMVTATATFVPVADTTTTTTLPPT